MRHRHRLPQLDAARPFLTDGGLETTLIFHRGLDLPTGTGDRDYLRALDDAHDAALPRARPDVAFYLAGADPFEGDRLGRLALTKAGLRARDELVVERLRAAGAAVVVVLAGGYARDVADTVDINAATAAVVAAADARSAAAA